VCASITTALSRGQRGLLELDSGAGSLGGFVESLITSETSWGPGVRVTLDELQMPSAMDALSGVVVINVLHQVPQPCRLFAETARCVHPGGAITAIIVMEPSVMRWSRLLTYQVASGTILPRNLKMGNSIWGPALFSKPGAPLDDLGQGQPSVREGMLESQIHANSPRTPLAYQASGGISLRTVTPSCAFGQWQ
jgi:hypothetical protein